MVPHFAVSKPLNNLKDSRSLLMILKCYYSKFLDLDISRLHSRFYVFDATFPIISKVTKLRTQFLNEKIRIGQICHGKFEPDGHPRLHPTLNDFEAFHT